MAQVKLIETEQPQQFKPVTIQITFETQEELNVMFRIAGLNVTIPSEFKPNSERTSCLNILKGIRTLLTDKQTL